MRHLLSGGFFVPKDLDSDPGMQATFNPTNSIRIPQHERHWRTIGPGPQRLVSIPSAALSSLGLSISKTDPKRSGSYIFPLLFC